MYADDHGRWGKDLKRLTSNWYKLNLLKCNPKKYQFSFCAPVLCRVSLGEFIFRSIDFIVNKSDYADYVLRFYFYFCCP